VKPVRRKDEKRLILCTLKKKEGRQKYNYTNSAIAVGFCGVEFSSIASSRLEYVLVRFA